MQYAHQSPVLQAFPNADPPNDAFHDLESLDRLVCNVALRALSLARASCLFTLGVVELLLVELVWPDTLHLVSH